jgi:hypothetical protein
MIVINSPPMQIAPIPLLACAIAPKEHGSMWAQLTELHTSHHRKLHRNAVALGELADVIDYNVNNKEVRGFVLTAQRMAEGVRENIGRIIDEQQRFAHAFLSGSAQTTPTIYCAAEIQLYTTARNESHAALSKLTTITDLVYRTIATKKGMKNTDQWWKRSTIDGNLKEADPALYGVLKDRLGPNRNPARSEVRAAILHGVPHYALTHTNFDGTNIPYITVAQNKKSEPVKAPELIVEEYVNSVSGSLAVLTALFTPDTLTEFRNLYAAHEEKRKKKK